MKFYREMKLLMWIFSLNIFFFDIFRQDQSSHPQPARVLSRNGGGKAIDNVYYDNINF